MTNWMNYRGVCKAAPGFARVCWLVDSYILVQLDGLSSFIPTKRTKHILTSSFPLNPKANFEGTSGRIWRVKIPSLLSLAPKESVPGLFRLFWGQHQSSDPLKLIIFNGMVCLGCNPILLPYILGGILKVVPGSGTFSISTSVFSI